MRGVTSRTTGADDAAGAGAVRILRRRFHQFQHRRAALAEGPSPEAVHDLRVASRRLLAALVLFRPLLRLPTEVRPSPLRRLERQLGKLRDRDVLAARLSTFPSSEGGPENERALARLEGVFAPGRKRALQRARAVNGRNALGHLTSAFGEWFEDPQCIAVAELPMSLLAPDLLLPMLARTLLHPGWLLREIPAPDAREALPLHDLRRELKVLRYGVECLAEWYGEPVTDWLEELHAMQDALGNWHDEGLFLARLRDVQAPEAMEFQSLERARLALAPWPAWRARYADAKVRAALRHMLET